MMPALRSSTGEGSLAGKVVLVTRPKDQARELVDLLEQRGAKAIEAPTIEIHPAPESPLAEGLRDLLAGEFDWLVLTSRAGAEAVLAALADLGASPGEIPASVAAVGDGTAAALRARGVEPDLVPETVTTESLGEAMPRGSGRVLLARADIAPSGLEEILAAKGWRPTRVDAYRTVTPSSLPTEARRALEEGRVDAITFTSASTVDGFTQLTGVMRGPKVVCIGPVTAAAARRAGMEVDAEAEPHTIEGLVAALERVLARPDR